MRFSNRSRSPIESAWVLSGRAVRVGLLLSLAALAANRPAAAAEKRPPRKTAVSLERILTTDAIWGKDFGALVRVVADADANGEKTLLIFPDRIVSGTKYASLEEAATWARRYADPALRGPLRVRPRFRARALESEHAEAARPEALAFAEDDSFRVVWSRPGLEIAKPGLTIQDVVRLLGPSEPPVQVVLQTQYELRPIILTLHPWAFSAVAFAESDLSPVPGAVDRIQLDVAKAARILLTP